MLKPSDVSEPFANVGAELVPFVPLATCMMDIAAQGKHQCSIELGSPEGDWHVCRGRIFLQDFRLHLRVCLFLESILSFFLFFENDFGRFKD